MKSGTGTEMMSLEDIVRELGIKYSTARYWINTGLVKVRGHKKQRRVPIPVTRKTKGELYVIARLREAGLPLQAVREAGKYLTECGFNPFSSGTFLVLGGPIGRRRLIRVCETSKEAVEVLGHEKGQGLLMLNDLVEEKDAKT